MSDTVYEAPAPALADRFGRHVTYLRLSVTDRCDLRCTYCMPQDMRFMPKRDMLSLEELERVADAFVRLGIRKIRITGGEPLVRRDVMTLFEALSTHLRDGTLEEVTLTTNGMQLARHAEALAAVGVRRVNVSLDSLDPDRFAQVTRGGSLATVLQGIEVARGAGLSVKINAVALRGSLEAEIDRLIGFAHDRGMALSLIETMPLGETGVDRLDQYLPLDAVRRDLKQRWTLTDIALRTGGPARYVRIEETGGLLGFITPLTHGFCEGCNRVRVTASGILHTCLGQEDAMDLKPALRATGGETREPLLRAILAGIERKPRGHDFKIERGAPRLGRRMSATGG